MATPTIHLDGEAHMGDLSTDTAMEMVMDHHTTEVVDMVTGLHTLEEVDMATGHLLTILVTLTTTVDKQLTITQQHRVLDTTAAEEVLILDLLLRLRSQIDSIRKAIEEVVVQEPTLEILALRLLPALPKEIHERVLRDHEKVLRLQNLVIREKTLSTIVEALELSLVTLDQRVLIKAVEVAIKEVADHTSLEVAEVVAATSRVDQVLRDRAVRNQALDLQAEVLALQDQVAKEEGDNLNFI